MKGYKGFSPGLICRGFQFEIGVNKLVPRTGYKDISLCWNGLHFCKKLENVFSHYANDGKNIFAEVEATGKVVDGGDKSCTDELTIIRILPQEEVEDVIKKAKEEYQDNKVYCLHIIKHLQRKYEFSVGGSVALYLNGLDLNRKHGEIDIDVVMPFYQKIVPDAIISGAEEFDEKGSGNDFGLTYVITTKDGDFLKLDIRIKPDQRYENIEYKGTIYKTSSVYQILEAKAKYAREGNKKHQDDIKKLLGLNNKAETIEGDDPPF